MAALDLIPLSDKETQFLKSICSNTEIYSTIYELVQVTSQTDLLQLPALLRSLSYENNFLLTTRQIVMLTVFAKGYLFKVQGSPVLLSVFISSKVQEFLNDSMNVPFEIAQIRLNIDTRNLSADTLQQLGYINPEDPLDVHNLEARLKQLNELIFAPYDRLRAAFSRNGLREGLEGKDNLGDKYYILSLAGRKYYSMLIEAATELITTGDVAESNQFLAGLKNYLMLKLANQPYSEIYQRLEDFLTDTTSMDNQSDAVMTLHHLFYTEDNQPQASIWYSLSYGEFMRGYVKLSLFRGLPGKTEPEIIDFVYEMWEFLASLQNRPPDYIFGNGPVSERLQRRFFNFLLDLAALQRKGAKVTDNLPSVINSFRSFVNFLETENLLHRLLPPTMTLRINGLLSKCNSIEAALANDETPQLMEDGQEEPVNQPIDIRSKLAESLVRPANIYRHMRPHVLGLDLPGVQLETVYIPDAFGNLTETQITIPELSAMLTASYEELMSALAQTSTTQTPPAHKFAKYSLGLRHYRLFLACGTQVSQAGLLNNKKTLLSESRGLFSHLTSLLEMQQQWLGIISQTDLSFSSRILRPGGTVLVKGYEHAETKSTLAKEEPDLLFTMGEIRNDATVVQVVKEWSIKDNVVQITVVPYLVTLPSVIVQIPPPQRREIYYRPWKILETNILPHTFMGQLTRGIPYGKENERGYRRHFPLIEAFDIPRDTLFEVIDPEV